MIIRVLLIWIVLVGVVAGDSSVSKVDKLVDAKLVKLNISASPVSDDQEFMRREYLDVTGRLPTIEEVESFLSNDNSRKRAVLIDALFDSEAGIDYRTLKLCDLLRVKSEYPSNLWPNAVQAYYRWIRDAVSSNMPYNEFAYELLTSTGSNFRYPAINYYRALRKRDPNGFLTATFLIFMGMQLEGNTAQDYFSEEALTNMEAFFASVSFKSTKEWKEEIVYLDLTKTFKVDDKVIDPKLPEGSNCKKNPLDPRAEFACWLISPDNEFFAKSKVNRIWYELFGRGIINPPDGLKKSSFVSNPELLDFLTKLFVDSGFDTKLIYKTILNSETYQRSSTILPENRDDVAYFSHYVPYRLDAEVLLDAIDQLTGVWEKFTSRVPEPYTFLPYKTRSVQVQDGTIGSEFLSRFGRPSRDSSFISDRSREPTMPQAMVLMNSGIIEGKLTRSPRINAMAKNKNLTYTNCIEQLYMASVSREPTESEMNIALNYCDAKSDKKVALQDITWVLINSKEFIYNH
jgi:hypothetical protein